MVGVLVDQHMGQQTRPRPSAFNRARWQCSLCERLTARTGKARPYNAVHDEPAKNVFQLFGYIFSQTTQTAAALGAIIVATGQFNLHARDVIWDRTSLWFVFWFFVWKTQLCRHLGNSDLARFQRQLKLFDALRRRSKPMMTLTC